MGVHQGWPGDGSEVVDRMSWNSETELGGESVI